MESLIAIVSVVFGVLSIALFFKIWGMTNDIKKIKDAFIAVSIKQDNIKVGDIVIHREKNNVCEVIEVDGDMIKCRELSSKKAFTYYKGSVFVINQK